MVPPTTAARAIVPKARSVITHASLRVPDRNPGNSWRKRAAALRTVYRTWAGLEPDVRYSMDLIANEPVDGPGLPAVLAERAKAGDPGGDRTRDHRIKSRKRKSR